MLPTTDSWWFVHECCWWLPTVKCCRLPIDAADCWLLTANCCQLLIAADCWLLIVVDSCWLLMLTFNCWLLSTADWLLIVDSCQLLAAVDCRLLNADNCGLWVLIDKDSWLQLLLCCLLLPVDYCRMLIVGVACNPLLNVGGCWWLRAADCCWPSWLIIVATIADGLLCRLLLTAAVYSWSDSQMLPTTDSWWFVDGCCWWVLIFKCC